MYQHSFTFQILGGILSDEKRINQEISYTYNASLAASSKSIGGSSARVLQRFWLMLALTVVNEVNIVMSPHM